MKSHKLSDVIHLLMLTTDHVVLIPDIQDYFFNLYRNKDPYRVKSRHLNTNKYHLKVKSRCWYCQLLFDNAEQMQEHLTSMICYSDWSQPPIVKLLKGGKLSCINKKNEWSPELIIIVDSEAMLVPTGNSTDAKTVHTHIHKPISFGAAFCDREFKLLTYEKLFGENMAKGILPWLNQLANKWKIEVRKNQCTYHVLTDADEEQFQQQKNCEYCGKIFLKFSFDTTEKYYDKNRHHCYNTKVIYDKNKKVISGNYLGASCRLCNTNMTNRREKVIVIGHNLSSYDIPILLGEMVSDPEVCKKVKVLPKGGTSYYNLRYKSL